MTTIAFKDGILAADSCATVSGDQSGDIKAQCKKLYRKTTADGRQVIIATAGDSFPGIAFVDWYGSGKEPPERIADSDFTVLILVDGALYESDGWCLLEEVVSPYYAIGSGRKCAMAAMACGKTAIEAVEIAAMFDPYTAGPFVSMSL